MLVYYLFIFSWFQYYISLESHISFIELGLCENVGRALVNFLN